MRNDNRPPGGWLWQDAVKAFVDPNYGLNTNKLLSRPATILGIEVFPLRSFPGIKPGAIRNGRTVPEPNGRRLRTSGNGLTQRVRWLA